ncbi:IPT/TIG domain-containing protein [Paenibacillus sp. HN-1]|uniref:alpha-amylase family glycosyl hydrolase n=1 Tax=Paenibacillus TaxID=44249 RepID=UPI001CA901EA|nr:MULTISPECIES: alpha-amylase family glycosyl hydrolase [Paenibacillus]MBY9078686.1 IPT/TIG domain-containing protein [Paenibacillus sp. CGMCC 1.18879]MBY9084222.1 IPT/TIG domain-containing protein [Paenibacillus sinensis]
MKSYSKVLSAVTLSISMALVAALPAWASPDTSVSNKLDYSTDVIYQIVTDRFSDGDSSNNPTGSAFSSDHSNLKLYFGGDWKGITNKINDGYLTDMGVTAIWISQPVENITSVINYSGVNNTAYHGYWARDFKKTNTAFGSFSDFQTLIDTAHSHNLKVIIDFAPNHTSPASSTDASFAENGALYDNGTLLAKYGSDPNGLFHHNGGTDFSTIESGIYKNLYDLADINQNNNTIDAYFKDAIQLWLGMGVDGIRFDAVKHMPFGWQKSFVSSIYSSSHPVFTFGEWFLGSNETSSDNINFANNSGMNLLDFAYAQEVREVFKDKSETMTDLNNVINSTASSYNYINNMVTFIDNHDMDRFQVAGASTRPTEQALALTLTSRGVPAIYYGTEQYMTGVGDPNNRAMMTSFDNTTTAYKVIKALAPLRKTNPAIAYGTTTQRWMNNDVYIYERKFGNSVALVAINRNTTTSYPVSGLLSSLPAGTYTDVLGGLLNGNSISVSGGAVSNFTLAAGGTAVWQYSTSETTPTIANVGPTMGKPGNTITIDGRGFGSTAGTVYFGTTAVTGSNIVSWEDSEIKVKIPSVAAGITTVKVANSSGTTSAAFNNFNVLTADQVTVRFKVNNATTSLGTSVYLVGSAAELGAWSTAKAIGPMYNVVEASYPTWYFDVSVPAGTALQFKFIKSNGTTVTWEGGSNHTYTSPTSGVGTISVDWQN